MSALTRQEYIDLSVRLRKESDTYTVHEEISQNVTKQVYEAHVWEGEPALALVRVYRLTRLDELPPDLQGLPEPEDRFVMVLTGTYGMLEDWRTRQRSVKHKAISINRIAIPAQLPMFERLLVDEMQVDLDSLYQTQDLARAKKLDIRGSFYIEDVPASSVIPDQDEFVEPYGVKSLVGFGGLLPDLDQPFSLYMLFAFSRQHFSPDMAEDFQWMEPNIALTLTRKSGEHAIFSG